MSAGALTASVLVLNRFYMAVQVVSARRAFALLAKDQAEVVMAEGDRFEAYSLSSWIEASRLKERFAGHEIDWVRTVSMEVLVPRIIRLVSCERLPAGRVKFNRRNLFARDESRCQYCGKRFSTQDLSIDHIVPRSRGGLSTWMNVVVACTRCNARKGGRLPLEAGMRLIREPFVPKKSPLLDLKTRATRYASWRKFLDEAYWSVELR